MTNMMIVEGTFISEDCNAVLKNPTCDMIAEAFSDERGIEDGVTVTIKTIGREFFSVTVEYWDEGNGEQCEDFIELTRITLYE